MEHSRESGHSKLLLIANLSGIAFGCLYERDWALEFVSKGNLKLTGCQSKDLLFNQSVSCGEIIFSRESGVNLAGQGMRTGSI